MNSQRTAHPHTSEFDGEPIRGLPELLPEGEQILWQGAPNWQSLAIHAYHVRAVAIYFAVLLVWRTLSGAVDGETALTIASALARLVPLACAAVALLALFAWMASRATVYTITNQRVALRIGIALPMTINIPFRVIAQASAKVHADGSGDIPLTLVPPNRLAFLVLWPHCRPWLLARPEPMLRSIPDAARVADVLAKALAASAGSVPVAVMTPQAVQSVEPKPFGTAAA